MGLRERKKAETRAALSWAAVRLSVERGFDQVRVEEIAEAAGVSPRTFNNYFSSKGEAVVARHLDRGLRIAEALRECPAELPLWEAITGSVLAQFAPDPALVARPVTDGDEWRAGARALLAEPALQGEMLRAGALAEAQIAVAVADRTGTDLRRELYPHLVAAAVMAAINAVIAYQFRTEQQRPMGELLAEALTRIAAGLPNP